MDVLVVLAGIGVALPARGGPDATRIGHVDAAGWGQLVGALATVRGEPSPWYPAGSGDVPPELGPALADAESLERALDLPGALDAYTAVCAGDPGETPRGYDRWKRGCEGAVRMAFGVQDPAALDETLERLLRLRPDHPFPPEAFPPPVAARARQIAAELPRGTLTVAGATGTVEIDGEARGQAPLRWTDLPAGAHLVQCGGWSVRIEVEAGDERTLRCPPADDARDERALLSSLAGGGPHWVMVDGEGDPVRIPAGTWVFHGGGIPVGLWVGPVPPASAIPGWEQHARGAVGR